MAVPKKPALPDPLQAARYGRRGKRRSPWRFGIPGAKKPPRPDWLK